MMVLALALPAALLAGRLAPLTLAADAEGAARMVCQAGPRTGEEFRPLVGTLDTVGGTTYDWQSGMPAHRLTVYSAGHGVHTAWMYSAEMSNTAYPDRNIRYNYYDFTTRTWLYNDPDYMQSGVNVYDSRTGYHALDADPVTGRAVVVAHSGSPIHIIAARQIEPGSDFFEYADGSPQTDGYQWPTASIDSAGTIHVLPITAAYLIGYIRIRQWPTWEILQNPAAPDPGFPTHNIAASKYSEKVTAIWEYSADDRAGYYCTSTDGGDSWGPVETLLPPPAFGGDTISTFHIASFFPFYDHHDELHIAATVTCEVAGQGYTIPVQLWHWCASNTPNWTKILDYRADTLAAGVGYNATFACRPNLGEDSRGRLYCVWEQFDSLNYDPVTMLARADIYAAASEDNGQGWLAPVKLTEAGNTSLRFPAVIDMCVPGSPETLMVRYMIDPIAGFFVQGEHPGIECPMVVQKVPVTALGVGVGEGNASVSPRPTLSVAPSILRDRVRLSGGSGRVMVIDAGGRVVRRLVLASGVPLDWDGRDDAGRPVAPGVYVVRIEQEGSAAAVKVVRAE
jgi:hypothetical protein